MNLEAQGRIPPYDEIAEQAILGSVLLDNSKLPEVGAVINTDDLYVESHRRIYGAMIRLAGTGVAIDHVTLGSYLKESGDLQKIGGAMVLAKLTDSVSAVSNVGHYAQIVYEMSVRRKIIYAAMDVYSTGYIGQGTFEEWLIQARESMAKAFTIRGAGGSKPRKIDADLRDLYTDITERKEPEGLVKTGLSSIDKITGGLWPGIVTLLAGRPGMGKSAVGLNVVVNVALSGVPVLYLTMEDTRKFAVMRMLARFADVDLLRLIHRTVPESEFPWLLQGICKLSNLPLWVDDTSGLSSAQIRAKVLAHAMENGCGLVVIDHLHEVIEDAESETIAVSKAAGGLRDLIKDMNIPGLLLAQLNRGVESRPDKRPTLADLKQSGKIEEIARIVIFLYRQGYYDQSDNPLVEAIVAKQNHGKTGTAYLYGKLSRMHIRGWNSEIDGDPMAEYMAAESTGNKPGWQSAY